MKSEVFTPDKRESSSRVQSALEAIEREKNLHDIRHLSRTKSITAFIASCLVLFEVILFTLIMALFRAKPVPPGSRLPDPDLVGAILTVLALLVGVFAVILIRSRLADEDMIQQRISQ